MLKKPMGRKRGTTLTHKEGKKVLTLVGCLKREKPRQNRRKKIAGGGENEKSMKWEVRNGDGKCLVKGTHLGTSEGVWPATHRGVNKKKEN